MMHESCNQLAAQLLAALTIADFHKLKAEA